MTILVTISVHNCVRDTSEQITTRFIPINVCSNWEKVLIFMFNWTKSYINKVYVYLYYIYTVTCEISMFKVGA